MLPCERFKNCQTCFSTTNIVKSVNPLRTEVFFCHQNHNAKNIGNFWIPLKLHNIGTHLKGIETSFLVVPLFFKSFHFSIDSYKRNLFVHDEIEVWVVCLSSQLNFSWLKIQVSLLWACSRYSQEKDHYYQGQFRGHFGHISLGVFCSLQTWLFKVKLTKCFIFSVDNVVYEFFKCQQW
jgi:hypothetical protein